MIVLRVEIEQKAGKVHVEYTAGPRKDRSRPTASEVDWTNELVAAIVKHLAEKGCGGFASHIIPPV